MREMTYQFLPSLNLDEYEALRESIREKGVIESILVDEEGNIIDGHHRLKACEELGIECPKRALLGLSDEQKQDLSLDLNLHRRQLTKEQKKELAGSLRERGWTQERIGKALGVTQQTISNWLPLQKFVDHNSDNSPSPSPTPTQNLEAIIAERLAEERAGMEATIRERVASVEQHYKEQASRTIAERVRMEADAAEQRLARQREEYEAKLREAEARQQGLQELEHPRVEVREVVPPEVEEKLRAMASELEEIAEEREALQKKLTSLQKAGKDLDGIQKQIAECHKSYERLKAKYDADDRRMQEGVALSNAVMEVQDFLEERKGRFERLAKNGILPWMSAPKVADVGSLCIEIGEMLIAATQVVSVGNPDKEGVVYIDGRDGQPVELQRRDERDESAGAGGDAGENLCPPDRGQAELQGCV